jgi:catechol 2,3-dioxygenase-like lactoylglutathione lyase family enzyme
MIRFIEVEREDVVAFALEGRVSTSDIEDLIRAAEGRLARFDRVRVYAEVQEIQGLSLGALLREVEFAAPRLDQVSRKAVVSSSPLHAIIADFAQQILPGLDVRHFSARERDLALRWIQDGRDPRALEVDSLDHVETLVPDLEEGKAWLERCFGLHELEHFREAAGPAGPVMLSSDEGYTKVALFQGDPRGFEGTRGHRLVAFRVDGKALVRFLDYAHRVPVHGDDGRPVRAPGASEEAGPALVVHDHDVALSVYFCDPWGNRYEVTTYEVEEARERLAHREPPQSP